MNKKNYLNKINQKLVDYAVSESDINDILIDYEQMYDDALDRGLTDEEVYQLLGNPDHVINELRDTLTFKRQKQFKNKFIALTPFISVIIFMVVGLTTSIYHPTWLVFLIIPMSAIILNTHGKEKLVALSPFIALITFIIVSMFTETWQPTWLIFLIIPILGLLSSKNTWKKILSLSSLLIAVAFYLYMGYEHNNFEYGALGFILPIIVAIIYGDISVKISHTDQIERNKVIILISIILLSVIVFFGLGFLLTGWAYAWMVFLFIPMISIYLFDNSRKLTPFMPFIAVIIFFSVGYFFSLFQLSWIAFLLIPIVAVIENA